jgi:hypothetical protein
VNRRSVILTVVSLPAGLALVAVLVAKAHVDPRNLLVSTLALDHRAFLRFTLWMALNVYLSSLKWRLADDVLRAPENQPVGGDVAFTATAFGVALGQVLPSPVSMAAARTLTSAVHGRALRRGTFGTLFEQSFDLLAVCILAISSLATCTFHRGAGTWIGLALSTSLVTVWAVGRISGILNRSSARVQGSSRWKRAIRDMQRAGLMQATLGRKLMALSFARFILVVLAAGEATAAIHAAVPLWYLAVAMPLVLLAMVTGIAPGGLGLVEFTYVGVLHFFGIPVSVATEWALAARVFSIISAFMISTLAAAFLFLARLVAIYRTLGRPNRAVEF